MILAAVCSKDDLNVSEKVQKMIWAGWSDGAMKMMKKNHTEKDRRELQYVESALWSSNERNSFGRLGSDRSLLLFCWQD